MLRIDLRQGPQRSSTQHVRACGEAPLTVVTKHVFPIPRWPGSQGSTDLTSLCHALSLSPRRCLHAQRFSARRTRVGEGRVRASACRSTMRWSGCALKRGKVAEARMTLMKLGQTTCLPEPGSRKLTGGTRQRPTIYFCQDDNQRPVRVAKENTPLLLLRPATTQVGG